MEPRIPEKPRLPVRPALPDWAWVAILFSATVLVYFPSLRGGMLWDDDGHVTKPALRSLRGLWRIWFEVGATQQYYPVLHSAFWGEHALWGDATLGYHLVNLFGHAGAACLFACLLRRLFPPAWRGAEWLAALLFALHPVAVESVAWISEQKNVLSTVFYLAAALAYLRFDEKRRGWFYALASGFFFLAVGSKTVAATLPAALLVIFWWRRGSLSWRRDVAPLLPWFCFSAAAGLLTAWVERRFIGAQGTDFSLTGLDRCLLAGRVAWFYFGKLAWPFHLVFIYPRWRIDAGAPGQYLYALAALAAVAALWRARRRSRGPLAAVLFFVGSLFPALGFVNVYPFRYSFVADHFQYLADLGLVALAAGGWAGWAGRTRAAGGAAWTRRAPGVSAALVVAGLAFLTWRQTPMYGDIDTLYRTTLERNPGAWLAHNNLAGRLFAAGRWDEAIGHYEEALRLDPRYPEAYDNLGIALASAGRPDAAIGDFQAALRLRPEYAEAHYNLGLALSGVGRLPEAIDHYRSALRFGEDRAEYHNSLGAALARTGRLPAAIEQFEAAVRLQPDNIEAHGNLGLAWRLSGRPAAAAAEFAAVQQLRAAAAQGSHP